MDIYDKLEHLNKKELNEIRDKVEKFIEHYREDEEINFEEAYSRFLPNTTEEKLFLKKRIDIHNAIFKSKFRPVFTEALLVEVLTT